MGCFLAKQQSRTNLKDDFATRRVRKLDSGSNAYQPNLSNFLTEEIPDELVNVLYLAGAFGIKGGIKAYYEKSLSINYDIDNPKMSISDSNDLWICRKKLGLKCRVLSFVREKDYFKLFVDKITSRNLAEEICGYFLSLPREILSNFYEPKLASIDVLNYKIINISGVELGIVDNFYGNGFHNWIFAGALAIPFVEKYIKKIDTSKKVVWVDWEKNW